jgi:hypothetical protein
MWLREHERVTLGRNNDCGVLDATLVIFSVRESDQMFEVLQIPACLLCVEELHWTVFRYIITHFTISHPNILGPISLTFSHTGLIFQEIRSLGLSEL